MVSQFFAEKQKLLFFVMESKNSDRLLHNLINLSRFVAENGEFGFMYTYMPR